MRHYLHSIGTFAQGMRGNGVEDRFAESRSGDALLDT